MADTTEQGIHNGWAVERHIELGEIHQYLDANGWRVMPTSNGWRAIPPNPKQRHERQ